MSRNNAPGQASVDGRRAVSAHRGCGYRRLIPDPASDVPMHDHRPDHRLAAAECEFVLDHILTALWHGHLTRETAVYRIMAKLGMSERDTRAEVDDFLRD
jgi:hypothetical protein